MDVKGRPPSRINSFHEAEQSSKENGNQTRQPDDRTPNCFGESVDDCLLVEPFYHFRPSTGEEHDGQRRGQVAVVVVGAVCPVGSQGEEKLSEPN